MRLTYVFHSGYVIEADGYAIIIDYYKDTGVYPSTGYIHDELLKRTGRLYVLSSHSHPDHFNPEILKWKEQNKDTIYIFSRDILHYQKAKTEDAVYLMKGERYEDELLNIQAFGSTDIGISFLIRTGGKIIFHAGDLNNWHWSDESTHSEILKAQKDYMNELDLLTQTTSCLDLAMFPVDPRLGTNYALGAEQFIERLKVGIFAPMHFGEWYTKLLPFQKYAEDRGVHFTAWTEKGQNILF